MATPDDIGSSDAAAALTASDLPFDERLGVHTVFVSVARRDWVFVKLLIESYEGLGVTRTLERYATDGPTPRKGASTYPEPRLDADGLIDPDALDPGVGSNEDLMVLMTVPDMVDTTVSVLAYLVEECGLKLVRPNEAYRAHFRESLLAELDG